MVLDTEAFKELKRLTKSQGNFGQSNQRKKRAERRQNFEPNFDDYNYSDYSDSDYEAGGSSRRRQRGTGQVKRPKKQLQATHAITTKLGVALHPVNNLMKGKKIVLNIGDKPPSG